MKTRILLIIVLIFIETICFDLKHKAWAYAGFSRSYNLPCEFCHIQWPKLSDQGEFFKDRGFMLSTTGKGNGLDMMFSRPEESDYFPIGFHMSMAYGGQAIQGVGIPSNLVQIGSGDKEKISPISLGGNGSASNGSWVNGSFAPTPWSLLSGGLLSSSISYWVEPGMEVSPSNAATFNISSLWVRFDALLGTTLLNLYAGATSQDTPFSNRRALQKGEDTPYVMYDYIPGSAEVVTNSALPFSSFGAVALSAYFDADRFQMKNDHTAIRYFGYLFENGCGSEESFSFDPCETRLSISAMPNNGLYSNPDGVRTAQAAAASGISENNNGWSIFSHLTQSFGGWGATNGERIGLFSLVGQESMSIGGIGSAPNGLYHREGMDFAINPLPDGGLNLFGAWEVVFDPSSGIVANPAIFGASLPAISGLSYMAWFLEGDWQPTFNGVFSEEGTGSNMIILSVNQLTMLEQPTFEGITQKLPGNFNDVISIDLADRYSLFASDRTAISFFAEWQWMINEGVGSIATFGGSRLEGFGTTLDAFSNSGFYNVESNVFIAGIDFSF